MTQPTKPTMSATPSPLLSKVASFLSETRTQPKPQQNEPQLIKSEEEVHLPKRDMDSFIKPSQEKEQVEIEVNVMNIRKAMEEYQEQPKESNAATSKEVNQQTSAQASRDTTLEEGIVQYAKEKSESLNR
jgi:hypothetical protein